MKIINKAFTIGDTYRGTRGDLFTVTATGTRTRTRKISGTRRTSTATVTLTHESGKAYELDLSHAQRLLLTKC
mgnify:FL=1|jgi:hypothetical protein